MWQQRKLGEAEKKFETAVELDPNNANSWNGLGWARFNNGDSKEAIAAFEKCVTLEPSHAAGLNGLGQADLSERDYAKAEKFLLKAAPNAPAAWYGLSRLYLLTGKFDKAKTWTGKGSAINRTTKCSSKVWRLRRRANCQRICGSSGASSRCRRRFCGVETGGWKAGSSSIPEKLDRPSGASARHWRRTRKTCRR